MVGDMMRGMASAFGGGASAERCRAPAPGGAMPAMQAMRAPMPSVAASHGCGEPLSQAAVL